MNAVGTITRAKRNLREALSGMDDREKLCLIDYIADTLSDEGIQDEISLSVAFDRAEVGRNGYFFPFYPSHIGGDWKEWRVKRDERLAYVMGGAF